MEAVVLLGILIFVGIVFLAFKIGGTKEQRTVMLVMYDGDICSAVAEKTQSGWKARWISNADQWSILLPDGKVYGTTLVKAWLPESGWDGTEFPAIKK